MQSATSCVKERSNARKLGSAYRIYSNNDSVLGFREIKGVRDGR